MQVSARGSRRRGIALALIFSSACLIGCSNGSGDSSGDGTPGGGSVDTPSPGEPPTSATDTLLNLGWQPSPESITGYLVYYGTTPDSATTLVSDLAIGSEGFDANTPSMRYYATRDLKLNPGDPVCFRIRAYYGNNVLSDWSQATCGTV
jgi:hypothetical protein